MKRVKKIEQVSLSSQSWNDTNLEYAISYKAYYRTHTRPLPQTRTQHPAPANSIVHGHLTENGRVMGFLVEKVEGRFACSDDLAQCEALLRRLHGLGDLGLVPRDVNRYNFIMKKVMVGLFV